MSRNLILWTFLSIPILFFAQKKPMTFGEVGAVDRAMTIYPEDSTANAVVLGDFAVMQVVDVNNEYRTRIERHRRLKILTEAGLEYANVEIPYYSYEKTVGIGLVKAQITNPDGSVTTLSKKDFFEEAVNEYYTLVKFAFPNAQVGSVIEWQYETLGKNVHLLPTWYFQEEIPVVHNELWFYYPRNFAYQFLFEGNIGMTKREEENIIYLDGEAGNMKVSNNRYILTDGKAIKQEAYITTINDYRARIRFQLDSYTTFRNELIEVLSSWEEVAKELQYNPMFGTQINKKKYSKGILEEIQSQINNLPTEKDKAQYIYNYFANNFEWDGVYDMFPDRDLAKVNESKKGSSSEINLLQLNLLKSIGIDANPLLVSTRRHGKMYEQFPMLHQFNHVLIHAILDGKETLIDVPSKNRPMHLPTRAALNRRGVVMYPTQSNWIDINTVKSSDVFAYDLRMDGEGTVAGDLKCVYSGYNAIPERVAYRVQDKVAHWIERFNEAYPDVKIDSLTWEDLDAPNKKFKDGMKVTIPEAAQVVGDFIYFNPILYSNFSENPFDLEERYFPVDFSNPIGERVFMKLKIPDGYQLEELPESANFMLPDKGGSFRYVAEQKDDHHIQVMVSLNIKQLRFDPIEYPNLKELFDLVEEKMGEQIVLKIKE